MSIKTKFTPQPCGMVKHVLDKLSNSTTFVARLYKIAHPYQEATGEGKRAAIVPYVYEHPETSISAIARAFMPDRKVVKRWLKRCCPNMPFEQLLADLPRLGEPKKQRSISL